MFLHRLVPKLSACLVLLALAVPAIARAEAVVVVTLRRVDGTRTSGTVQLTRGDDTHRCTTDAEGRCEIRGVAGGTYTVTVRQAERPAPKPRTVMIPPTGEVKLIVNAS